MITIIIIVIKIFITVITITINLTQAIANHYAFHANATKVGKAFFTFNEETFWKSQSW